MHCFQFPPGLGKKRTDFHLYFDHLKKKQKMFYLNTQRNQINDALTYSRSMQFFLSVFYN